MRSASCGAQVGRLARTEHENERLREALDYRNDRPELDLVTARVVGRDSLNVLETIVINRGTASGIRVGMAVVAQERLAVGDGRDRQLGGRAAYRQFVQLGERNDRQRGLRSGRDRRRRRPRADLLMRRIEPDVQLSAGDFVVTSGLGGGSPRGIPVGREVSTERPADSVFPSRQSGAAGPVGQA